MAIVYVLRITLDLRAVAVVSIPWCHSLIKPLLFVLSDIVVGLVQEEYTVSENDSVTVCAALNQTTSRRVVVRIATVESAPQTADLNQAKGTS